MRSLENYGGKNWEKLWYKLEQEGDVGIDYIINPFLYRTIADFLLNNAGSKVVDFGAGTNILAIQFMYGYQSAIPALSPIINIAEARKNVDEFIGLEGSSQLVLKAKNYLRDLGYPGNIGIQHFEIKHNFKTPIDDSAINLAISRNLLMHLDEKDLDYHLSEVARILRPGGEYICAFLNPDYEQKKYLGLHAGKKTLLVNERYSFSHGSHGEYVIFFQYWRDIAEYERLFNKHLNIFQRITCLPITDGFKEQYVRYYQENLPVAYIYILKKMK